MLISRARGLSTRLAGGLLVLLFALWVVASISLVGRVTLPLVADIPAAQVQWAIVATALAVGLPVICVLSSAILWLRVEKMHLTSREALLNTAQQYARIGYWEYDIARDRFILPEIVHRILGDPEQALQVTIPMLLDMTHPLDREALAAALNRIVEDGTHEQMEYRLRATDGTERTFWATATRLMGRDGLPAKIFGLFQDITERKAIEVALRESENHYRHAVELNPGILWVADAQGNVIELSSRLEALTGLSLNECLGNGWFRALHPDDVEPTLQVCQQSAEAGAPLDVEYRVRLANGQYRWFRDRGYPLRDTDGRVVRRYGTIEDVHDRKVAELALRASEAFSSSILENTADCVKVMSLDGRLEYMNRPGLCTVEIEEGCAPIGALWRELWPEEARQKINDAIEAAQRGEVSRFTGYCPTAKGTGKWWDVSVSPIPGPDGMPVRLLATSRDITAQKLAQDDLFHLAHHDSLTGLPNRKHFLEGITQALKSNRDPDCAALLLLDLDEFKSLNDALGHPAGDQLLMEAAQRLQGCLRGSDLIARLGGDEFAVFIADLQDEGAVRALAERIVARLSQPYRLDEREVVVGVSIGIKLVGDRSRQADDLFKRADIALYRAKAAGRGTYRLFEPGMDRDVEERQALTSDLRGALARGEFELHYQPIVGFASREVSALEALLRWRHPERGLMAPSAFIALLEEAGTINEVGAWVLEEACRTAASWPVDVAVSVNLSPRQFRDGALIEAVSAALEASRLPAHRLRLEITESLLLQDSDEVSRTLQSLRDRGTRLSIDDFGTGYSSLGYLRSFCVDCIKVDRSFVVDLVDNTRTSAILRAVIGLGEELGVSITAEGVETAEQMEELLAMGCSEGQGYLFGRPMPACDIPRLIEKTRQKSWLNGPARPEMIGFGDARGSVH